MRTANAALTALLNGQRKALKFDGISQQASLPQVNIGAGNMSFECWANLLAPSSSGAAGILSTVGGGVGRVWLLADTAGRTQFNTTWGVSDLYTNTMAPALGSWHHYALTCDRRGLQFGYFDGVAVDGGQSMVTAYGLNWDTTNWICSPVINSRANCIVKGVRRYARVLSAAEVADHMRGTFRDESGLIGNWEFDEGSGTTAFDLSGKGNNGALTGSPVFFDFNPYPGSERQLRVADLVTITMINGTTLRYTSSDSDITSGGFLFDSKGPLFTRGKTKLTTGIAVDVMDLTVMPSPSHLINGTPFMQAVTLGFFDGAIVQVERAFMPAWGNVSTGTLIMFTGRVADMESSRARVAFKVKSDLELLNIMMPRNIYQPGCVHTLYDNGCTAKKALFAVRSTVAGGSTTASINSALTTVAGEFELGTIEFEAAASLPGTVGNYITTPDAPANRLTGDAMWTAKVSLTDWTPAVLNAVICKRLGATPATASYVFGVNSGGGTLLLFWSDGASQFIVNSTIAPTVADGAVLWIRATLTVNNGAGGNDVRFWTSLDNITWTQLGATVTTAGVTSIRAGTDFIELGTQLGGTASPLSGKIYYADIRNGINGPIVAKFDPTIDTPQGTGILSSTGELWSMVGTPALVGMTNRGVRRTVKAFSAGNFSLIQPLPNAPVTGDLFAAYAGCDKLQSTCGTKIGITYTVDNTTDIFTATAHGLTNDLAVKLTTTGTFPTAVPTLDAATPYFVINAAANTFQLARSPGGPAIDMSSNGTGVNKVAMKGKFANLDNFRGFPYVPIPETMI